MSARIENKADSSGVLYFDINEKDDGTARRDNTGILKVQIQTHK